MGAKTTARNLLANAVKFSPPERSVELLVQKQAERVRISVRDQGRGIPLDLQTEIFEKYKQASKEDCGPGRGTGLGLAISRLIIEQHSGSIGVISEPGKGSEFWFTVPSTLVAASVNAEQTADFRSKA